VEHMLGQSGQVSQRQIEELRAHYGLDRPLLVQYGLFVRHAATGDFGPSYSHQGRPVGRVLVPRLVATFELTFFAFAFALLFAIPAGMLASLRPQGFLDRGVTLGALLGISFPGFWLGIVLMIVFGLKLHWLPISGRIDLGLQPHAVTGMNVPDALLTWDMPALKSAPVFKGTSVRLRGLLAGKYRVEVWDTYKGTVIARSDVEAQAGSLTIPLPEFRTDCALKVKPAP